MWSCPRPVVHAVNCLLEVKSFPFGVKARECCHCYSQHVLAYPLCVYAHCFKACELEWLTALYKCRIGQVRKICLMQYVKAGQNVNNEMFNQFPEQLILKRALPISVIGTGKFTGFICNDHSWEGRSFLFWLLWVITVELLSDLNVKLTLLESTIFDIFSSLNCLCHYSNWKCRSPRLNAVSCLWNAINVIVHVLHRLEIMALRRILKKKKKS